MPGVMLDILCGWPGSRGAVSGEEEHEAAAVFDTFFHRRTASVQHRVVIPDVPAIALQAQRRGLGLVATSSLRMA